MNRTKIFIAYVAAFVAFYLLFSLIGLMFNNPETGEFFKYTEIISSYGWISFYSLLIGWWAAAIVAYDYQDYLEE
jgi:hypothetical protein